MLKKLLLIANIRSGKTTISKYLANIIDYYNSNDFEVTIYITQNVGHSTKIVKEKGELYDNIVCCGGDGTLNEVVTGILTLNKKPLLGYIPCGSTNDFANTIGLPLSIEKSYKTAISDNEMLIDVGDLNGKIFTYVSAFGIFTNVTYETPQNMKNMLGHMAYVLEGMKQIVNIPSYKIKVEYDGGVIEDNFVLGFVANSKNVGGFKIFNEDDINLDDGLFEVILVRSIKNINDVTDFMACFLSAKFDRDLFVVFKTSKIKFTSDEGINWTVDGEFCGTYKEANIVNHNKALSILK